MPNKKSRDMFSVTFWGVRGTLASPGCEFRRTGGNTICAQLQCGDRVIVFDAGTGIRALGSQLIEQENVRQLDLMLTHVHYDHVEGIPFFAPFFSPKFNIDIWLGKLDGASSTRDAIEGLMRRPYFPVGPDVFQAGIGYRDVARNAVFDLGDGIEVRTMPMNHPGGATGYRVDYSGRSFAFVTDTEHLVGETDMSVVELIEGVDCFAYDSSLTDAELPDFAGYGHSTWEEGLRLREKAGAGAVFALHHMPFRTDEEVDAIEAAMQKRHARSGVAREGQKIDLLDSSARG
ncbi:MAG: MBL fold metallo-hydrolase [Pseudomonadota bacterium]|nr:MBL fold metallo-hydrolase [Pseudomonadota bacterium]